ncbi:MAG TPA: 16S rRNA (cytosine(967)-C(5))-methyltransferase, partial [Gammaproteobacteria bacterium]|nr:16S rRNA (cytosine(967)-C(5))-methyltransferase [Gammaproteobacteria bacterium]
GLWPLLAENGRLFYTTCSIFQQENSAQIAHFLATHPEAEEVLLEPEPATRQQHGYQRLPGEQDMDGFFYACLRRR